MTRQEFLQQVGRGYRHYFDRLFYQAGTRFRTRRAGNQGHAFTNETGSRTLRSPDGHAIITFRLDRSLSIDRFGMTVRFDRPEQAERFLGLYPAILDALARQEGLE